MNRLFRAWVGGLLPPGGPLRDRRAPRPPAGRGPRPAERAVPDPGRLREAFLWSERRRADQDGPGLRCTATPTRSTRGWPGKHVELLFAPFDLDRVEVRLAGRPAGAAVPFAVGQAPPPQGPPPRRPAPRRARPHRDRLPRRPRRQPRRGPERAGLLPVSRRQQAGAGKQGRRKETAVTDAPRDPGPGPHRGRGGPLPEPRHPRRPGPRPARRRLRAHRRAGARRGRPAQLLAQVGRWLAAALAAGQLGCDDGTDPAGAVSGAWLFISDARSTAAALARDLGQARAAARRRPRRAGRREGLLMINAVVTRFGLARMPFGRDLPRPGCTGTATAARPPPGSPGPCPPGPSA